MGRWGDLFFDDDLALDVKAEFDEAIAEGGNPAQVAAGLLQTEIACEILDEFPADERDEMFWEESAGLIFSVVSLQLEHNVLQPDARALALEAIKQERNQGASDDRIAMLNNLEQNLT